MRSTILAVIALIATGNVFAESSLRQFSDWTVGLIDNNEGVYAATLNDSGGIIGQYCFFETDDCIWLMSIDVKCTDDSKYPILINSDYAAAYVDVTCTNLDNAPRYIFNDFELLKKHVTNSRRIGLAFPMQDGKFQVSRFSLDGAIDAINFMAEVYREATRDSGNRNMNHTRDTVL
ncbi:MAG: hypothetical protein QG652_976 [Pseudomonadota bacterium]|nr:hypothetical protein [Pseudomonadota bacterium]